MFCFIKKCVILCGILIKGRLLIMKVNKILAFMFILELCIIPLQGCGAKSITADSTETQETQAQIDDAYGKGLSFTYNDYADNVLSLSYNLKQNADGSWQLSVSGQNAHVNGTKVISDNNANEFFYYLLHETNIATYKDYNKTDDSITSDVAWWFNLNIYYDKDSIVAYGYMMHPSDYDDIRVQITEYLNDLFKNA